MCTRVLWSDSGQGVLVGRNMDWHGDMATELWVLPRGADRVGMMSDPYPLVWQAEYGSVVATSWNLGTNDGVNEAGLAGHMLWLAETDFGPRDPSLPAVSAAVWLQYFLDRYPTVDAAVRDFAQHPFQVRPQTGPGGETSTVHLALEDAAGDSAIIEFLDGQPHVHHDRAYTVMTNSPPFDEQHAHLKHYEGFGGGRPLPGTTRAADRFVRASYYSARLPEEATKGNAYAALLSVMRNAAQPFGVSDPARPDISSTIWRTLLDLSDGVYAFESSFSPNIVWVRTNSLDYGTCLRFDPATAELLGDVTARFTQAEPFAFLAR